MIVMYIAFENKIGYKSDRKTENMKKLNLPSILFWKINKHVDWKVMEETHFHLIMNE